MIRSRLCYKDGGNDRGGNPRWRNRKPDMKQFRILITQTLTGPLLMLASALLFTGLNLIVKLLGAHFRVWDIGVYRFLGGMAMILVMVGPRRNPFQSDQVPLLVLRGLTGSIAFLALILAIRMLPVSTALVYFYTYPAFAAIFAPLIYREQVTRSGAACITMVFVGILILFDFSLSGGWLGQGLAVTGGLFAGLTVVLIRELRASNDSAIIYLYFCAMGLIVCLPGFLNTPVIPSGQQEWLLCLGLVATSLAAQLLMNQGFAYCRSWEGGLFMSTEVLFTALVGIAFLGDPLTWRLVVGGSLILGSVIALNLMEAVQVRRSMAALKLGQSPKKPVGKAAG